jgi:uncharacterized protein YkwD
MKFLILIFLLISCSNVEQLKYVPKEFSTNDTLIVLINKQRENSGLNQLIPEKQLTELSKEKAIQMELRQELNHDGFTELPVKTETFAQIVGYGYKTETNLFNSYMTSENHKESILGNFTHIGSYTYKSYNCVLFAKY